MALGIPVLREGSRGGTVIDLQSRLNACLLPQPKTNPDGSFGPNTRKLVEQFQIRAGLKPDGVVGPATGKALEAVTTTMTVAAPQELADPAAPGDTPWLQLAYDELKRGVAEVKGAKHNARIIEYHATTTLRATTDETAWCSSFVNWCIVNAGLKGTNSAAAASWLTWGSELTAPKLGAITVIKHKGAVTGATGSTSGNHVGFLLGMGKASIKLLGGNQSDSVKISDFRLSGFELRSMRWPK